jgi:hypothetical protein
MYSDNPDHDGPVVQTATGTRSVTPLEQEVRSLFPGATSDKKLAGQRRRRFFQFLAKKRGTPEATALAAEYKRSVRSAG